LDLEAATAARPGRADYRADARRSSGARAGGDLLMTILITGGAGYIGSLLTGVFLQRGCKVVVIDDLLFGGDSLLAYFTHPHFEFHKANVTEKDSIRRRFEGVDAVVHLAALVGFPACQQVGPGVAWLYNLQGTKNVYELAREHGVGRFVFASTYSNYGLADNGGPVTEESPLNPQSLYAETKIAAERYLVEEGRSPGPVPILFRFATLFGLSPRTRFDLIINQFVLEAIEKRNLIIYQRNYNRSFVHIRDIAAAVVLALECDIAKVASQVFNVGSSLGNYSKEDLIHLIQKYVPGVSIQYKDLSFGGDMRDIKVSFDKIERVLGFRARVSVEEGIQELVAAIQDRLLYDPHSLRNRNAQFIVQ
jgi:nucleoside-diphosphate-sugar epimerase